MRGVITGSDRSRISEGAAGEFPATGCIRPHPWRTQTVDAIGADVRRAGMAFQPYALQPRASRAVGETIP